MKISNSKKELARIISENGGWRDEAEFAAQDQNASVTFFVDTPWRCGTAWEASGFEAVDGFGVTAKALTNWHQTLLSRDEYFHLYPAPDAGVKVTVENRTTCHLTVTDKPTIEQLAADYRNCKDYADRKQQEADAAKADADEKLRVLEIAGEALGLLVSPITTKQEYDLVIADWRDLQVGDEVELVINQGGLARVGEVGVISRAFGDGYFNVDFPSHRGYSVDHCDIKFIRRP